MTEYADPKQVREFSIGLLFHKPRPIFHEYLRIGANARAYSRLSRKEKQYIDFKVDDRLGDAEIAGLWGVEVKDVKRMFYKIRKRYQEAF